MRSFKTPINFKDLLIHDTCSSVMLQNLIEASFAMKSIFLLVAETAVSKVVLVGNRL